MTEQEQRDYESLQGEFIGFLIGLSWWKLPEELVVKIKEKKRELIDRFGE